MGEERNLEKRLIPDVPLYDGLCINDLYPEIIWSHEHPEPIGTVKDVFNTEAGFECTIEPKDERAFRRLIGLPEVPLSKVKRRRKTVKKALMAYGKSRDKAEVVCEYIARSNGRVTYSDMCANLMDILGR